MAILPIRIWGDPVLTRRAAAVDRITADDRKLIEDMKATMRAADGIGLAAPQVGVSRRIFVFRRGDDIHALINPKLTKREGGRKVGNEGCLSIPGVQGQVARHARVVIAGRNEKGKAVEFECEDGDEQGRASTCVQHELDHLDGVLYLDKAVPGSISWLIEAVDEEGEDTVLLQETTLEEIRDAYRTGRFPPNVHISEMLRARLERVEDRKVRFA